MANPRISAKERGLLKGAIRRVFSRSELRRKVLDTADIEHFDPKRPRVRKWSRCPFCKEPTPKYLMQVDHIQPIVPVDTTLEAMDWDTVINSTWCQENNLTPTCQICHTAKTKAESVARKHYKKGKNNK